MAVLAREAASQEEAATTAIEKTKALRRSRVGNTALAHTLSGKGPDRFKDAFWNGTIAAPVLPDGRRPRDVTKNSWLAAGIGAGIGMTLGAIKGMVAGPERPSQGQLSVASRVLARRRSETG